MNEEMLVEWSRWLASQKNYQDAPSDYTGQRHMDLNAGRSVWFLTGTWGEIQSAPRTIQVPTGTSLFIVAAFSCTTDKVMKEPKLHPRAKAGHTLPAKITNPSDAQIKARVKDLHDTFPEVDIHLTIDEVEIPKISAGGDPRLGLTRLSSEVFTIDIEGTNPVGSYYGYPGIQKTATVGHVYLLEYVGSSHKIKIQAKGGLDPYSGEPAYNLETTYNVVVV